MAKIFLCYRRDDTRPEAGRLYDHLAREFGESNVFFDINTLEYGENFETRTASTAGEASVLLVLIGPQWLTLADEEGGRRIDDPEDVLRHEILSALADGVRVIPILVNDAQMPSPEELPEELASISKLHAARRDFENWKWQIHALVSELRSRIQQPAPAPQHHLRRPAAPNREKGESVMRVRRPPTGGAPQGSGKPAPSGAPRKKAGSNNTTVILIVVAVVLALACGGCTVFAVLMDAGGGYYYY